MCVQEGHKEGRQEHDHHLVQPQLHRAQRREPGDARVRGLTRDRDRHGARRQPRLQPAHRHDQDRRRQKAQAPAALRRRAALQRLRRRCAAPSWSALICICFLYCIIFLYFNVPHTCSLRCAFNSFVGSRLLIANTVTCTPVTFLTLIDISNHNPHKTLFVLKMPENASCYKHKRINALVRPSHNYYFK